ncbi:MAG TPA: hypothetical protein VM347_39755 [Nonomuraea sp.]|nr:hypothetical protein [Nonomuraea sp.]
MLHSPARTRGFGTVLTGQRGNVVAILRHGTLALLELDNELDKLPGGVRRWPVHWDDLLMYTVEPGPLEPPDGFRLGLSGVEGEAVQHAVRFDTKISLCGEPAFPLPICDWSIPFSPMAARACPACVRLAARSPQKG